jgi:hypothetical protein
MAKFPYTAAVIAKTLNGDGSTSFTYTVKDGNAGLLSTEGVTIPAGVSADYFMKTLKSSVKAQMLATVAVADIAIGASFSFQPQDFD